MQLLMFQPGYIILRGALKLACSFPSKLYVTNSAFRGHRVMYQVIPNDKKLVYAVKKITHIAHGIIFRSEVHMVIKVCVGFFFFGFFPFCYIELL